MKNNRYSIGYMNTILQINYNLTPVELYEVYDLVFGSVWRLGLPDVVNQRQHDKLIEYALKIKGKVN